MLKISKMPTPTQMIIVGTLTSRAMCRFLMSLFTYKFADKGS